MRKYYPLISRILLWIVPLLLVVPNVALSFTEQYYSLWARIANVALPLGVYYLLMAWSRKVGRTTLFLIPVMVLCAFQIVLLFLYGESIIAIDMFLNVVTTNFSEATELLGSLGTAVAVVVILYLPPIVAAIVVTAGKDTLERRARIAPRRVGTVLAAVGAITMIVAYCVPAGYMAHRELFPVNVCYNIGVAAKRTAQTKNFRATSAGYTFGARRAGVNDSVPAPIYVLVIGETSRADNWQLGGYDRPTNPRLSRRDNLVWFGKTLSESNTTHKSVPLLMSPLTADTFGDSIYSVRSVIDAFNEAGFSTAWLSNQQRNGAIIDFFGEEADTAHFLVDDGAHHLDMDLCPALERVIEARGDEPLFAVLHTYGSHFKYCERYPRGHETFGPVRDMQASSANRAELVDAYDNSICYVDAVLDSIAGILEGSGRPAAMLYLADHGEDIFDDSRERFLHASPTPTYWQLHVPMLVWADSKYVAENVGKLDAARRNADKNVSSSRSAFHTLLSLAGITAPCYDATAALTSDSYTEPERRYLDDYNEGIALTRAGLREPDYAALRSATIDY